MIFIKKVNFILSYDDFFSQVILTNEEWFYVPKGYSMLDINEIVFEYNQNKRNIRFYKLLKRITK